MLESDSGFSVTSGLEFKSCVLSSKSSHSSRDITPLSYNPVGKWKVLGRAVHVASDKGETSVIQEGFVKGGGDGLGFKGE